MAAEACLGRYLPVSPDPHNRVLRSWGERLWRSPASAGRLSSGAWDHRRSRRLGSALAWRGRWAGLAAWDRFCCCFCHRFCFWLCLRLCRSAAELAWGGRVRDRRSAQPPWAESLLVSSLAP